MCVSVCLVLSDREKKTKILLEGRKQGRTGNEIINTSISNFPLQENLLLDFLHLTLH